MATELSTDDTPQKQNLKIDCKCCRSVVALLQVTENHIMKLFEDQNENLIGTDVFQTYKKLMMSNILMKGEPVTKYDAALDTTTEFEPFDVEKEKYIQHDLMERLDRHFVSTTRLRKSASKQVRRKVKSLIRPELKYVALLSVDTKSERENCMETDTANVCGSVNLEEVEERVQGAVDTCSYNKQFCGDMLQKARDISQAIQIFKQSEKSDIVKAMYETPPNTPVAKNGLDKQLESSRKISKKLLP
ncbi:uncharacterized protein LOC132728890 [Ruditapes philippinarum]|uniref:uncharacterized protein LOC132728890 n=1 Tax=Ruditapes philippinarum TaxID=129788 RepID=UPI00295BB002|nr:uncharacterized protein LOC132728890 [Ruditapes philippinarum]